MAFNNRFGDQNDLTFAMPANSWMFSFKEPFDSSMVMKLPWASLGYDMFIFHRHGIKNDKTKMTL